MANQEELRTAFESRGYEVGEISINRDQVRISILDEKASPDDLRDVTNEVIPEEDRLGFDVQNESSDAHDGFVTVVSFRDRS